ncbi:hypothetical protein [Paratractidigestivibacter sp.]|uniref:hypothetical protein n=1 Tax=Paratractidigestivibacter sp. TaxID=2847316 RepID=UPI002ABD4A05|nr:hypothetical protein [Paratractidigestivibacter sp.]
MQEEVPEGFTLSLALVDALPVAFFATATFAFGSRLNSGLFIAGAVFAVIGGTGKVAWKLVMALGHKNLPALARQMRVTMPIGFVLIIAGCVAEGQAFMGLTAGLVRMPSLALLLAFCACMVAMGWFAGHMDQADARANWVEQLTNACGQACLLAAVLLA